MQVFGQMNVQSRNLAAGRRFISSVRTIRLSLATALAVLMLTSPARADAPWSPPAAVPVAPGLPAPDRLVHFGFAPDGIGLIASERSLHEPRAFGASISASGAVAPAGQLTGDMHVEDIALYGRDRMVAAGAGAAGRSVRIAGGVVGGSLGRPRTVLRRGIAIALDANAAGAAAMLATAFLNERGSRRTPVLVVRRPGGGFGRPVRLDRAGRVSWCCGPGAVSVNRRGDVLAVWTRNGRAIARIRTASGRLGPRHDLGLLQRFRDDEQFESLSVALGDRRNAVVAFARQAYDFIGYTPLGPLTVRAASAGAGGRFGRTRLLERTAVGGRYDLVSAGVGTAVAPGGRATVAWTGREGEQLVVRATDLVNGRPGRPQTVSPPTAHSVLTELAAGPRGELVLGWRSGLSDLDAPAGSSRPRLFVSPRPAAASAFTAAEAVTEPSLAVEAAGLAVNPASRQVMAVWTPGSGLFQYATRPPVEP